MFPSALRQHVPTGIKVANVIKNNIGGKVEASASRNLQKDKRDLESIRSDIPTLSPWFAPKPSTRKNYSGFIARYYAQHILSNPAQMLLSKWDHPCVPKTIQRWRARDPNGLWWHVQSLESTTLRKGTIRHHQVRRLREAMREELRERQWDEECRPLQEDGRVVPGAVAMITGSLRLRPTPNTLDVKYDQLRVDCKSLIDELLGRKKLGGSREHRAATRDKFPKHD